MDMFFYEPKVKIASTFTEAELRLFDKNDSLIWAVPLAEFTRDGIASLVHDLGFHRKSSLKENFPEEYRDGAVSLPGGITLEELMSEDFNLCEKYEKRSKFMYQNENDTC